jgi:hypothetical protein
MREGKGVQVSSGGEVGFVRLAADLGLTSLVVHGPRHGPATGSNYISDALDSEGYRMTEGEPNL